jgi:Flagellar hook-length control protein FliK
MFGLAEGSDQVDSNIPSDKTGTKVDAPNVAQLNTRVASDTVIADALIRSMLGGRAAPAEGTTAPAVAPLGIAQAASAAKGDLALAVTEIAEKPRLSTPLAQARDGRGSLSAISGISTYIEPRPKEAVQPLVLPQPITLQVAVTTITLPDAMAAIDGAPVDQPHASQGDVHPQAAPMQTAPAGSPIVSNAPLAFSALLTPISQTIAPESAPPGTKIETDTVCPLPLVAARCPNFVDAPADAKADPQESKSKATISASSTTHPISRGDSREDAPRIIAMAASTSPDGFTQAFDNPTPPTASHSPTIDSTTSSTFGAVADSLRASETAHIAAPVAASSGAGSTIQDITVRVNRPDMPAVDLRVTERAGEIQVTVRTSDSGLETSLRRDLPTLTNSLEHAGYRTETYVPRGAHENAPLFNKLSTQTDSREDREARKESSGKESGDASQDASRNGSQGRQQGRRHRDQQAQNWIDQMEKQS